MIIQVFITISVTLLITSGCATLLSGTKDTITFNSAPQGAIVCKDSLELCSTPYRVPVKRSLNSSETDFRPDGYETRYFALDKEMNFVSVINLGNMFGWAVDAATGSIVKYSRKTYDMDMRLSSLTFASKITEIFIDTEKNTFDIYSPQK